MGEAKDGTEEVRANAVRSQKEVKAGLNAIEGNRKTSLAYGISRFVLITKRGVELTLSKDGTDERAVDVDDKTTPGVKRGWKVGVSKDNILAQ
jgi:hypothetical protein